MFVHNNNFLQLRTMSFSNNKPERITAYHIVEHVVPILQRFDISMTDAKTDGQTDGHKRGRL